MSACPDEGRLVAFGQGLLDGDVRTTVANHVDECEDCSALVALAIRAEPATAPTENSGPAKGDTLGRYMVLDRLGAGGLGEVFCAYDPELDRKVAIKVLRSGFRPAEELDLLHQRLLREAKALAKVSHPNVVGVHDVGVAGAKLFIAMEFAPGVTLRAWLADGDRSAREIIDVFLGAADGLAAAHAVGLVHRDFKPSNVLVGPQRVRVVDFGLARAVTGTQGGGSGGLVVAPAPSDVEASITASGMLLGTPAYMAPEQYTNGEQDARGDQFSFCVALFEALYGVRPFLGKSIEDIVAATKRGQPQRPKHDRRVPIHVRRAVMRGLAADPTARFETMAGLMSAVRGTARRRRAGTAAVLGALLLGGGVWAGTALGGAPATQAELDAVAALTSEARLAASRAHFVYPPASAPRAPTAYQKVLALEELRGAQEPPARASAAELRDEFADTLVQLGDRYWEREGGRGFAADYYAEALMFRPADERAGSRALVTDPQLEALRLRAEDGSFAPNELIAVAPLEVLAADAQAEQRERLERVLGGPSSPSAAAAAQLLDLVGGPPTQALAAAPTPAPPQADGAAPAEPPPAAPVRTAGPGPRPSPRPKPGRDLADAIGPTSPATASELVERGKAAMAKLDFDHAKKLFHRALRHNPRSVAALAHLRDLHFQTKGLRKAIEFGERAVKVAPRNAAHRIRLGDLFVRRFQYARAQAQYEAAVALNDKRGAERLARLRDKMGQ